MLLATPFSLTTSGLSAIMDSYLVFESWIRPRWLTSARINRSAVHRYQINHSISLQTTNWGCTHPVAITWTRRINGSPTDWSSVALLPMKFTIYSTSRSDPRQVFHKRSASPLIWQLLRVAFMSYHLWSIGTMSLPNRIRFRTPPFISSWLPWVWCICPCSSMPVGKIG